MTGIDSKNKSHIVLLKPQDKISLSLGKPPRGHYAYRFTIINPSLTEGSLFLLLEANEQTVQERTIPFSTQHADQEFSFESTYPFSLHTLTITLKSTNEVSLRLPVSAVKIQQVFNQPAELDGLDQKILSRLSELDLNESIRSGQEQRTTTGEPTSLDISQIESLLRSRYFKGFLSLEEAVRQLDYVVYHKSFSPDGSKGFNRIKRKIYRKILTSTYRMLTKNQSRKLYFGKLYRNYINSNSLSENLHHHQ